MSNPETELAKLQAANAELKLAQRRSYETTMVGNTSLQEIINLSQIIHGGDLYLGLKSQQYTAALLILGRQYGLTDAQTLSGGIHIVKDKPMLHYSVILSKVRNHPHYDYKILERTDKVCRIEFYHKGESCGISEFTIEQARKRGTQNIDKMPEVMLTARAVGDGVRTYCPDVLGGTIYAQGEIIETTAEDVSEKTSNLKDRLAASLNKELPTRTETGSVVEGLVQSVVAPEEEESTEEPYTGTTVREEDGQGQLL